MLIKIKNWLASFLELQLIISLLSLPLLIHWGLAVSYMLPIANIIFTPLLALFLWCSCLFTLCSVAHIPCGWLTTLLDYLADVWHYLLSFARPDWLIGFDYRLIWISLIIALSIIFVYTFFQPNKNRSLLFLTSCCLLIFSTRWLLQKNCFYKVNNLSMYVIRINNTTYLIDNGALCSKQNFYSWIDYTIFPELIKSGGITTIDTLVLYKPHKKLIPIIQQFAQQALVKNILVTVKHGCYYEMKEAFKNSSVNIIPIYQKQFLQKRMNKFLHQCFFLII